jgi:hypothetical protein
MRYTKFIVPAFVLATGLLFNTSMSYSKPQDTKTTKKACGFCHTSAKGGKDLTEAGQYYKEKKTLDGYTAKK